LYGAKALLSVTATSLTSSAALRPKEVIAQPGAATRNAGAERSSDERSRTVEAMWRDGAGMTRRESAQVRVGNVV
jgi:hypothetical protein